MKLADRWRATTGPDFITIDGGEGGTGASPLIFTDAVSLPFRVGLTVCTGSSPRRRLHEGVTFIGAGRLGLPDSAVVAFALGATWSTSGGRRCSRSAASRPSGATPASCPTGVTTQHPRLTRGLDPMMKGERVAKYIATLRRSC